jgi:hypothetical protein
MDDHKPLPSGDLAGVSPDSASDTTTGLVDQSGDGTDSETAGAQHEPGTLLAKGYNGQVTVAGDWMTIGRKGLGRVGHSVGERRIAVSTIKAVQFHAAGALTNGFLRVAVPGSPRQIAGLRDALKDDNSVVFTKRHADEFTAVQAYLETYIAEHEVPEHEPLQVGQDENEWGTVNEPVMTFKSHIEGKNADVAIWPDRIEWGQNRGAGAGRTTARWTAAAATGGLSLFKTGLGGRDKGTNMIPVRMIQGVSTRRKGITFTIVRVATGGDAVEFHVSAGDADRVKACIMAQMTAPSSINPLSAVAPSAAAAAVATAPSLGDEITKLARLRDSGIINQAEFDTAKAKLLA